ncbi:hypothetical protein DOO59_03655 [Salmonella enterica]|nr:hypothetical protein [Salmonella enterica]EGX5723233.1 hypothetical protein [Salmonella enterica]
MKAIPYFILCAIRNSKSLYSYKQIIKTHRDDLNPIFLLLYPIITFQRAFISSQKDTLTNFMHNFVMKAYNINIIISE